MWAGNVQFETIPCDIRLEVGMDGQGKKSRCIPFEGLGLKHSARQSCAIFQSKKFLVRILSIQSFQDYHLVSVINK
jgi:hypothetical protein